MLKAGGKIMFMDWDPEAEKDRGPMILLGSGVAAGLSGAALAVVSATEAHRPGVVVLPEEEKEEKPSVPDMIAMNPELGNDAFELLMQTQADNLFYIKARDELEDSVIGV